MVSAAPQSNQSQLIGGYVPVSLATILPESTTGMRLFLKDSPKSKVRLFCAEDTAFLEADRVRLIRSGHNRVYIQSTDQGRYQTYLKENIGDIVSNDDLSGKQRLSALSQVTRDSLATAFQTVKLDETLNQVNDIAGHCVELFAHDETRAGELLNVLCHDYHTFTHSANVAFYCVMLAKALGITDRSELHQISVGGFLHDLGKLEIPAHILTKPDKLTDTEYELIKDHPRRGFEKLSGQPEISNGQLMMAYQHHERIDGRGYPVGVVGDEIHQWAKICSVVDVFEALTPNRPYRDGYSPAEAIRIQSRDNGTAFDTDYLKCWINAINPS